MRDAIRVVLADGHPVCVKGVQIEISLTNTATVVGCAFNSTELFDVLDHHDCDVLVSDYVMQGADFGDGLSMFARIRRRYPGLNLVVLTSILNCNVLIALQHLGVRAIVSKADRSEHLRWALRAVHAGQSYRSPRIQAAFDRGAHEPCGENHGALTCCELEVLRLFLAGLSLSEIAEKSSRSKQTVGAQKRAAMRKLDVHNDIDLVRYGVRSGLAA
ncbi:response regulator transcription factor [Achromobacter piechaudii]|uniref:Transcriptional regulator, LuxR family n=1 Tax=Achromobacter piechaudii ATCC 43553 TaxID=742159 RepID=D4XFP2_9BURK|nr:response regulator transcription factor [Achromobacter piechaudii]EFF74334.1 transcriptional regulator, LuxR family [Achromobacter piechaudii ATCC 43553]